MNRLTLSLRCGQRCVVILKLGGQIVVHQLDTWQSFSLYMLYLQGFTLSSICVDSLQITQDHIYHLLKLLKVDLLLYIQLFWCFYPTVALTTELQLYLTVTTVLWHLLSVWLVATCDFNTFYSLHPLVSLSQNSFEPPAGQLSLGSTAQVHH